jgi:hypothetical protein
MAVFGLWAGIFVTGEDVTSREEAVEWVNRAQQMIDRIDDAYGVDVQVELKLQHPEEGAK